MRYINPTELDDLDIEGFKLVSSTSKQSADVMPPITLREQGDHYRFEFRPIVHNNEKHPENGVQGTFVYEKKRLHDKGFPTDSQDKISKSSVHVGDSLELSLSSSETMALYRGLQELYQLRSDMEEIPLGNKVYIPMDAASLLITMLFCTVWIDLTPYMPPSCGLLHRSPGTSAYRGTPWRDRAPSRPSPWRLTAGWR